MTNEKQIIKMHEAKLKRYDNAGLSAQIGGLLHDSIALVIAEKKINPKQIAYWLHTLREIADKEKEPKYNGTSVAENEEWQKEYNEKSKLDEVKVVLEESEKLKPL